MFSGIHCLGVGSQKHSSSDCSQSLAPSVGKDSTATTGWMAVINLVVQIKEDDYSKSLVRRLSMTISAAAEIFVRIAAGLPADNFHNAFRHLAELYDDQWQALLAYKCRSLFGHDREAGFKDHLKVNKLDYKNAMIQASKAKKGPPTKKNKAEEGEGEN